jgi:hypothetical protein
MVFLKSCVPIRRSGLAVTYAMSSFLPPLLAVVLLLGVLCAMARAEEFRRQDATNIRAFAAGKDVTDDHHTVE